MPNWDRVCTNCGFEGSYLDFEPREDLPEDEDENGPESDCCDREEGCGATVEWIDQDEMDLEEDRAKAAELLRRAQPALIRLHATPNLLTSAETKSLTALMADVKDFLDYLDAFKEVPSP